MHHWLSLSSLTLFLVSLSLAVTTGYLSFSLTLFSRFLYLCFPLSLSLSLSSVWHTRENSQLACLFSLSRISYLSSFFFWGRTPDVVTEDQLSLALTWEFSMSHALSSLPIFISQSRIRTQLPSVEISASSDCAQSDCAHLFISLNFSLTFFSLSLFSCLNLAHEGVFCL